MNSIKKNHELVETENFDNLIQFAQNSDPAISFAATRSLSRIFSLLTDEFMIKESKIPQFYYKKKLDLDATHIFIQYNNFLNVLFRSLNHSNDAIQVFIAMKNFFF